MTAAIVLGGGPTGAVSLDVQALIDTRLLVQANSGGGKSFCLRRILEQTHGRLQHLVIDPEGEFASLREKYDYVLAARNGGDTMADPRSCAEPVGIFVRIDGAVTCSTCWKKRGKPFPRAGASVEELHEAELATRERMSRRGGADRHMVRSGKS